MISGQFHALSRQTSKLERLRSRLLSRTALCGVISLGVLLGASPRQAKADPQGTSVVSGGVTIQRSGTHTQFNQTTNTAILNHSSFDIRANESVHFQQPSTSALAVNRIVGSDVSTTIAGKLTATGNVWVLNPSGVAISSGAQINVNGLVATTAKITDQAILAGRESGSFAFSGAADGTSVTNAGNINAGDGHVVLVAPVVENSGTITTDGSEIALGAGSGFTVDMGLDGLTRFEVQPGSGVSLTNTGNLTAEGGAVYLSADAAGSVEGAVVSVGGQVEATRIENRGGQIVISSGENGTTEITGTVSAAQTTGAGGQIVITGENVDLKETAVVDASGATEGGKVEIGGGLQGRDVASPVVRTASVSAPTGAPLPIAKRTIVREGAVIRANAGTEGNGGEVIVWSDIGTEFFGTIEARGGTASGDGGFAEVSGKETLFFSGKVDLTAMNGLIGDLLLDPDNITISANADAANNLDVVTLVAALNSANVTINTSVGLNGLNGQGGNGGGADAGTITVDAAIDTNISNGGSGATLTLIADDAIDINAAITDTGEALSLDLQAGAGLTIDGAIDIAGDLSVNATSVAQTQGVVIAGATTITSTGAVVLDNAANDFGGSVSVVASGQDVTLVDANTLDVAAVTANSITITADNAPVSLDNALAGTFATTNVTLLDSADAGSIVLLVSDTGAVNTDNAGAEIVAANVFTAAGVTSLTAGVTDGRQITVDGIDVATGGGLTLGLQTSGTIAFTTATTNLANLNVSQSGLIAQSGAAANVVVSGVSNLTSTGAITLDNTNNNFGTVTASAAGQAITFVDSDSIVLGDISGGTLNVTTAANGNISQQGGSTIVVTGTTSLSADGTGDVTLNEATNDFATLDATAANVTIQDATDITLDAISVTGNMTVTATDVAVTAASSVGGTLSTINSQGDAVALVALSGADTAVFDIDNTDLGNLTVGVLSVDSGGGAISVSGADALSTGNVDAVSLGAGAGAVVFDTATSSFEALTVTSSSAVSDNVANSISVTGDAGFTATGDILLDQIQAVSGSIDASGVNIDLRTNATNLTLDQIVSTGTLVAEAVTSGDILDAGTADISVTGAALFVANGGNINIDRADTHQFGGNVQMTADQVQDFSSTGNIVFGNIQTDGASVTNTLTTGTGDVAFNGLVTLGTDADLTLNTGAGNVTQVAGATITGDVLRVEATAANVNVTLNAQNAVNTLETSATEVTSIAFTDSDGIALGTTNTGQLTLIAGGNVTQSAGVTISGNTSISAATFDVGLSNTVNDFGTGIDILAASANLGEANAIVLGDLDITGTLSVTAGAGISDGAENSLTGDINVGNTTTLSAGDAVVLDDSFNDFATVTVSASGQSVTLRDTNEIDLGANEVNQLTVTAGGNISDSGVQTITGTSSFTATGFNIVLDQANLFTGDVSASGNVVTLVDADSLPLGTVSATSLTATSSGGDLVINNAIGVTGGDIALHASANVDINANVITTTSGAITIQSDSDNAGGGDVDIVGGTSVVAAGLLDINAGTGAGQFVDSGTGVVTLGSGGGFDFGTTTFDSASIALTAAGAVIQTGVVSVSETTSIITTAAASNVTLNAAANDFGGAVSIDTTNAGAVAGGVVLLQDANSITLGSIVGASVSANALGGDVVVGTAIDVTAGDIALSARNTVDINGNVTTTTSGNITLTSDSDADSSGDIDIVGGVSVIAADVLDVETNGGSMTDSGTGTVTLASGGAFEFESTTFDATDLSLSAAGTVSQEGLSTVSIAGNLSIAAGANSIALSEATNDFGTGVDLAGSSLDIQDANAIVLGDIDITGNASIEAGAGITDNGNSSLTGDVNIDGTTSLIAGDTIELNDQFNDFGSVIVTAGSQTVTLVDVDDIVLGATSATVLNVTSTDIDLSGVVALTGTATLTNSGNDAVTIGDANDADAATYELAQSSLDNLTTTGLTVVSNNGAITSAAADTTTTTNIDAVTLTAGAGAVLFDTGTNSFEALTVSSSSGITDTGSVSVTGVTDLASTGTIDLQTAANDFSTLAVSASGQSATIQDTNGITLAAINVGSTEITAGGDIIDTASVITVTGAATFTASGNNVVLDTNHEFGSTVNATGTTVTLNDANGIELGNVTATNLNVATASNGNVTQTGSTTVNVSGNTTINAGTGNISLTENTNDFADVGSAGDIVLTGGAISLVDVDSLRLNGAISAGSFSATALGGQVNLLQALSVTGGDITLSSTDNVFVRQNITTTTSGNITINADSDNTGSGQGVIVENGSTISSAGTLVVDSGASVLNDIGTGGATLLAVNDLTVDAATIDAGDFVVTSSTGNVSLTGAVAVTNNNLTVSAANNLDVDANLTTTTSGNITLTSDSDATGGGDVNILGGTSIVAVGVLDVEANTGQMIDNGSGTVTLSSGGAFEFESTTFDNANIAVSAAGAVTQETGSTVSIAGNLSVAAGANAITLSEATNDFGTGVDLAGSSLDLQDANAIVLGDIDVTGNASIEAGGGITDNGNSSLTGDVNIAGATTLIAGDTIELNDQFNDFATTLITAAGQNVTLVDVDDIDLGASTMNQLTLTAGGAVTDSGTISVTGTTSITTTVAASAVTLDEAGNDFGSSVSVDTTNSGAVAAGVVTLQDANNLTLAAINSSSLSATALDGDIVVDTSIDVTGGDIALTATNTIDINQNVTTTTTGNITLTSDSDASAGGDIDIVGGTSVAAASLLDVETNTGQLTDSGSGTVTLQSGDVFDFENTTFDTTSLVLTAAGAVTDTGATSGIFLSNDVTITAGGAGEFFDIALDTANLHDFGGTVNLTGEDITIDDVNAIVLGAVSTNEAAQADADADGAIDTTINTNRGDLIVRAGGTITDAGGATADGIGLLIEGVTSLDGNTGNSDITLDDADNDFDQDVDGALANDALDDLDASGSNIVLVDASAIALGEITTTGTLSVSAGGSITDTSGQTISVAGVTTLTAGGTGEFFDIDLDNENTHDFGDAVNATGEDITLDDVNEIVLGAISTNAAAVAGDTTIDETLTSNGGDLVVNAGGTVTDTANAISVTGTTSITAEQTGNFFDIVLDTANTHDFADTVNLTGEDITIDDNTAIVLGAVSTNESGQADADPDSAADTVIGTGLGDLIVRANGTITDAGDSTSDGVGLLIEGTTSLDANSGASDITLDDIDNDFDQDADGVIAGDARDDIDALGQNIVLVDASAVALGAVTASGSLSVTAAGSIIDTVGENISVAGITSLVADSAGDFFDIALDNAGHDFGAVVNATAEDLTLNDANALILGAVSTNADGSSDATIATNRGDLVVSTAGAITDDDLASGLSIAGSTSLVANGGAADIILDNRLSDFDNNGDFAAGTVSDDVNASGANVVLVDANTLPVGSISGASVSLTAVNGDVTNASNTGDTLVAGVGGSTISAEQGDVFLSFDDVVGSLDVEGGSVAIVTETGASSLTISRGVARNAFVARAESGDLEITNRLFSGGDLRLISEQGNVNFSGVSLAAIPAQVETGAGTANNQVFSLAGLGSRLNDTIAYAEGELSISTPTGTVLLPTAGGSNVPVRFISNSQVDVFQNGSGTTEFTTQDLLDLGFSSTQISDLLALSGVLEIEVGQNFTLQAPAGLSGALLTLDVPASSSARLILTGTQTDFAIGEQSFVNQAVLPGFDPINFIGSLTSDQLLFDVTGNFDLVIDGATSAFNIQNTSSVLGSTNSGEGMRIAGLFGITVQNGGTIEQFAGFGEINGQTGANAAFQFNINGFTPNEDNTINGCIIGAVSSCTPLGTLVLNLQFETGQFLGITFVDPNEDEDDPFTNRGDEEEWE